MIGCGRDSTVKQIVLNNPVALARVHGSVVSGFSPQRSCFTEPTLYVKDFLRGTLGAKAQKEWLSSRGWSPGLFRTRI